MNTSSLYQYGAGRVGPSTTFIEPGNDLDVHKALNGHAAARSRGTGYGPIVARGKWVPGRLDR
jgi:hypothetical protein